MILRDKVVPERWAVPAVKVLLRSGLFDRSLRLWLHSPQEMKIGISGDVIVGAIRWSVLVDQWVAVVARPLRVDPGKRRAVLTNADVDLAAVARWVVNVLKTDA